MSPRRLPSSVRWCVVFATVFVSGLVSATPATAQDRTSVTPISAAATSAATTSATSDNGAPVDQVARDIPIPTPTSGVPLAVGSGVAAAAARSTDGTLIVTSVDEFGAFVQQPSPRLAAGVAAFFANGGRTLYVQLTPDESATSLVAGLDAASLQPGTVDLVAVPSIGQLGEDDHRTVAAAADRLAATLDGIVLLDPPDVVVAEASADGGDPSVFAPWSSALRAALSSPDDAMVFSSGLLDEQDRPVPASLAVAGLISTSDRAAGVWLAVGGLTEPLVDAYPVWSVPNSELSALEDARVNSFRSVTGYGTVLWGNLMLAAFGSDDAAGPDRTVLGERRVIAQVEAAMVLVANSVVFQTNDEITWHQVAATLTAYLDNLWAAGGLVGPTAADAGSVEVGVPETMTALDVLNGYMIVVVLVAVDEVGEFVTLTARQEIEGP